MPKNWLTIVKQVLCYAWVQGESFLKYSVAPRKLPKKHQRMYRHAAVVPSVSVPKLLELQPIVLQRFVPSATQDVGGGREGTRWPSAARGGGGRRKGTLHLNGVGHHGAPLTTLSVVTLTTLSPFRTVAVLLTLLRTRWPQLSNVCTHDDMVKCGKLPFIHVTQASKVDTDVAYQAVHLLEFWLHSDEHLHVCG